MLKSFMHPGAASTTRTDSNRTSYPARPADTPRPAEAVKEGATPEMTQTARNEAGSKLIVGPNIKLKGAEITDCEILVVEGRVEASMNSRDIRIAEGGVFSGKAEIDVAEVRGSFEGELTARKRLVVYATGRVNGTIRYGALMVEEGGSISGNIALHTDSARSKVTELPSPSVAGESSQTDTSDLELARNAAGKRSGVTSY